VFTERAKDGLPFSFASCYAWWMQSLHRSAYCGLVDIEEVGTNSTRVCALLPTTHAPLSRWFECRRKKS